MKIHADRMKPILRPAVQLLHHIFTEHNYEFRVVGGAVRDLLNNRVPSDLDFATTATTREMKKLFSTNRIKMINTNGERHATITARIGENNFECSTLRVYKKDGTGTKMEFVHDFEQDAGHRDFTVNAMFLDLDGIVYDYFDGIQHLKERKIKFVGDPDEKIKAASKSIILRYFRFFGMLTDDPHSHDPEAIASIKRNRDLLSMVPPTAIGNELRKILMGKFKFEMLLKMIDCGLGEHIGLPHEFDCENVRKVYTNVKDTNYHYILLLAAGMKNEEQLTTFISRSHISRREKNILYFIIKQRDLFSNIQTVNEIKDCLFDLPFKEKGANERELALEFSKQLLIYSGRSDLLDELNLSLIPHLSNKKKFTL